MEIPDGFAELSDHLHEPIYRPLLMILIIRILLDTCQRAIDNALHALIHCQMIALNGTQQEVNHDRDQRSRND